MRSESEHLKFFGYRLWLTQRKGEVLWHGYYFENNKFFILSSILFQVEDLLLMSVSEVSLCNMHVGVSR